MPSSGTQANRTGGRLESFVEHALTEHGYELFWDHRKQLFANRDAVGGKQYAKHVLVGPTIYETDRYVDFLVLNKDKFPDALIIECKWQEQKGSVDEKYPFLMFNIARTGVPTIVLLDGDGYKPAAKIWLASHAGTDKPLRAVWSMAEFHRSVNGGFLA
jgi:hypothetical protein